MNPNDLTSALPQAAMVTALATFVGVAIKAIFSALKVQGEVNAEKNLTIARLTASEAILLDRLRLNDAERRAQTESLERALLAERQAVQARDLIILSLRSSQRLSDPPPE